MVSGHISRFCTIIFDHEWSGQRVKLFEERKKQIYFVVVVIFGMTDAVVFFYRSFYLRIKDGDRNNWSVMLQLDLLSQMALDWNRISLAASGEHYLS